MKNIKTIYNIMYARTLYIGAAALLALGSMTACSSDDDATGTDADGQNTPISATVAMADASGSVSRGFAADSKLSDLKLYYIKASDDDNTLRCFDVPDGTGTNAAYDYITMKDAKTLSFVTGKAGEMINAITPHLFWQTVKADKPFYLTVSRTDGTLVDQLWATATSDGKRGELVFSDMKSRYAKFTLIVNTSSEIMPELFDVTTTAYKKGPVDDITKQAINASITETEEVTLIAKAAAGTAKTQKLTAATIMVPQAMNANNSTLIMTFNSKKYTVDLSKVTVTRPADSDYASMGTTFAYNANEHITLTVNFTIATELTPGTVTVSAFSTDGGSHEFDGEYTPNK